MLEDGDFRLTESSAILKYLADKIGSPAYPKDLKQRAKVNEIDGLAQHQFLSRLGLWISATRSSFPHHKRRSDEAQAATIDMGKQNAKRWLRSSTTTGSARASHICAATRSPSPTISAPAW